MPFNLEIKDHRAAKWATLSNSFIPDSHVPDRRRCGVLIQLAKYIRKHPTVPLAGTHGACADYHRGKGVWQEGLGKDGTVKFFGPGKTRLATLTARDFESSIIWVNVVAGSTTPVPMEHHDLEGLGLLQPLSLHYHVCPYRGGITLWQAPNGDCDIKVVQEGTAPQAGELTKTKFRFSLSCIVNVVDAHGNALEIKGPKGVKVVVENGRAIDSKGKKKTLGRIERIEIVRDDAAAPGDNDEPPQFGQGGGG